MPTTTPTTRTLTHPFQGFQPLRRIADAVKVQVGSRSIIIVTALASVGALALLIERTGTRVLEAAATPDWRYLLAGLAICAAVQPLRALAWTSTVRQPEIGFRAMYTASSVGSFLDTVLPGRLGEASKVAMLKVTAGPRWPGFARGRQPALRAPAGDDRLRARRCGLRLLPAGSRLGEGDDGRRPPGRGRRS